MNAVAFDIDGTLSAHPSLVELANFLVSHGVKVLVLTGHQQPANTVTLEQQLARREQLNSLGVSKEIELYICASTDLAEIGRLKGELCEVHGAKLIFEDSQVYATPIRAMGITVGMVV